MPAKTQDRFVDEDLSAFDFGGFKANAFCPTGPGGGMDNSCAPGQGGGRSEGLREKVKAKHERFAAQIRQVAEKLPQVQHETHREFLEISARAMEEVASKSSEENTKKTAREQMKTVQREIEEKLTPHFEAVARAVTSEITLEYGEEVGQEIGEFLQERAGNSATILGNDAASMIEAAALTYQSNKAGMVNDLTDSLNHAIDPQDFLQSLADDNGFDLRAAGNSMVEELIENLTDSTDMGIPSPGADASDEALDAHYEQVKAMATVAAQATLASLYNNFLGGMADSYAQAALRMNRTNNAFCPTGEGGGQDNSCAPKGGRGKATVDLDSLQKDLLAELESAGIPNAADVAEKLLSKYQPKERAKADKPDVSQAIDRLKSITDEADKLGADANPAQFQSQVEEALSGAGVKEVIQISRELTHYRPTSRKEAIDRIMGHVLRTRRAITSIQY